MHRTLVYTFLLALLFAVAPCDAQWITKPLPVLGKVQAIASTPDGRIFAGVRHIGLFMSEDEGETWEQVDIRNNAGFTTIFVTSIIPLDNDFILLSDDGVNAYFRSFDGGETWENVLGSGASIRKLLLVDNEHLFAGTSEHGVLVSSDLGSTWSGTGITGLGYEMLSYDQANDILYAGSGLTLVKSSDKGHTWDSLRTKLPFYQWLVSVCVDPVGTVYLGLTDTTFHPLRSFNLYRSDDFGETWIETSWAGPFSYTSDPTHITSPEPGTILAGLKVKSGARISKDHGDTWTYYTGGMDRKYIHSIGWMPDGRALWGGSGEIYITEKPVGVTDEPTPAPTSLSLAQSYPNPVGPHAQSTVIEYALPRGGYISLSVYDLSGRLVQTLVESHQSPGRHRAVFNSGDLPGGLYIYRLTADGQTIMKKLSVVR